MWLFFYFEFSPGFGKIEILTFFKKYFLIKISKKLSTYFNYECLQLKKNRYQYHRKRSKKLLNFVKSPKDEINFSAPPI